MATEKHSFKVFTYRGHGLEALTKMENDELKNLFTSALRRRISKGVSKKYKTLIEKAQKKRDSAPYGEKPDAVKTHLRDMIILPSMVGTIIGVYNGKDYVSVEIKPEMIGMKLADFSLTYKPVKHGKPGIGATSSSKFVPLK
ncbi:hypothetical protein C9374_000179 [Naegleria lovaniensis]|uniref:40S ribosomal protein S15 n=1 Tax=Naegleria lovaniensis TaxID=51637 RepID=A0AA88GXB5_NAELO|nr:uncharacterized protein C9374_000179 [Naegleria lovaniensis]KAG2388740.1 hypothetical protein C9374_000179 [Naegleria lovaniensis]